MHDVLSDLKCWLNKGMFSHIKNHLLLTISCSAYFGIYVAPFTAYFIQIILKTTKALTSDAFPKILEMFAANGWRNNQTNKRIISTKTKPERITLCYSS